MICPVFVGAVFAKNDLPSESDFLGEMPSTLSVTRLAQPLNEAPGAVTILDREMIRNSGARDLADLLRLVPGYLVSGYSGANPVAAYHAPLDEFGARNLVMIDGRSVYSSFYLGDTHRGTMGVLLEDIERIEVLRGSNSAAFGANAMFGVINIVTRNAADTGGTTLVTNEGQQGIRDNYARFGWTSDKASVRFSAGRQADTGYRNLSDDRVLNQWHVRGDFSPAADQELMVAAGAVRLTSGEDYPKSDPELAHDARWDAYFLQGSWQKQLANDAALKLSANYSDENVNDRVQVPGFPGVYFDNSGRQRRINLELQHSLLLSEDIRAVWGLGYKYEQARSLPVFARNDFLSLDETRLFGTLEWRVHPQWLLNASGFLADHSRTGIYFAPRLMVNFLATPEHTFRAGASRSVNTPNFVALNSDVRLYLDGEIAYRDWLATGKVLPERLHTEELGYFGNIGAWNLTVDVRAYREFLFGRIDVESYPIPDGIDCPPVNAGETYPCRVGDFVNQPNMQLRGVEYQLRWRPLDGTQIWLAQNMQRQFYDDDWQNRMSPKNSATLALFQRLPENFSLSVIASRVGAMTWDDDDNILPPRERIDVRLAKSFAVNATKGEIAVTVQAANGDQREFVLDRNPEFQRRAFVTLRLDM